MAMKYHKRKPDEETCHPTVYQLMIGSLMNAMTATPSDIANSIGVLMQYNHGPSNEHMVALKCMFRYLNSVKDCRRHFGEAFRGSSEEHSEEHSEDHSEEHSEEHAEEHSEQNSEQHSEQHSE
jgi:hypothetical protein